MAQAQSINTLAHEMREAQKSGQGELRTTNAPLSMAPEQAFLDNAVHAVHASGCELGALLGTVLPPPPDDGAYAAAWAVSSRVLSRAVQVQSAGSGRYRIAVPGPLRVAKFVKANGSYFGLTPEGTSVALACIGLAEAGCKASSDTKKARQALRGHADEIEACQTLDTSESQEFGAVEGLYFKSLPGSFVEACNAAGIGFPTVETLAFIKEEKPREEKARRVTLDPDGLKVSVKESEHGASDFPVLMTLDGRILAPDYDKPHAGDFAACIVAAVESATDKLREANAKIIEMAKAASALADAERAAKAARDALREIEKA